MELRTFIFLFIGMICLMSTQAQPRSRPRQGRRGRGRRPRPTTTTTSPSIIHTVHNEDLSRYVSKNVINAINRLEKPSGEGTSGGNAAALSGSVMGESMDDFKKVPASAEESARQRRKGRRRGEKAVVRGTDGKSGGPGGRGSSMDCDTVMRDPRDKMSPGTKDMMCDMYKQWGAGMHKPHSWHPTKGQRSWFDSLGMKARSGGTTTTTQPPAHQPQKNDVRDSYRKDNDVRKASSDVASYHGLLQSPRRYHGNGYPVPLQSPPYPLEYPSPRGIPRAGIPQGPPIPGREGPIPGREGPPRRARRQSGPGLAQRREYRSLSDEERRRFHAAVRQLKDSHMDGMRKYDVFVGYHQANMAPGAHFGPAFLPWHRELLFRFENALREIDPTVSLPYWDSNLDHHIGDDLARQSMMWTDGFLGNGDGLVTSGPFAGWPLTTTVFGRRVLHRNLTRAPPNARTIPSLMSDRAVATLLQANDLREITWFVDAEFEGRHGATHNWVGGVMGDLANSPNDPAFFLHHAFIDCLWEQQRRGQARRGVDVRYAFPNDTRALGVGIVQPDGEVLRRPEESHHWWGAEMQPFGPMRNIEGLKGDYFQHYACVPSPSCSQARPDCGSPYMFCDVTTYRCAPKVRYGAPCGRFGDEICHEGRCCAGVCRASCGGSGRPAAPVLVQTSRNPPSRDPPPRTPPARPQPQPRPAQPRPPPARPQPPRPQQPSPQPPPRAPAPRPQRPPSPAPARAPSPTPSPVPVPAPAPQPQPRAPPQSPAQRQPNRPFNQFQTPFSPFPFNNFINPFNPFNPQPVRFNNGFSNQFNFFDPRFQRQFFGR